ncbi:hypothetical protein OGA_03087 [Enterococcus faecium EnGen0012]|uniref:hypothetical protein n=1 Tax=Enterococcus faecium TaxID=1352 RepID=UPI0002A3E5FB|nr:hypothetical protein [Enterococcus faecium]ELA53566.1 hypothetical protein OGA_03087 [Enterococcus faecium EnGen0012]HAZ4706286.1 hypothetical protein [Enterococcus faecium]
MKLELSKELINKTILEGAVKAILDAIEKDEARIKTIDLDHEELNNREMKLNLQIVLQK